MVLSASPRQPTAPLNDLRLRAVRSPQPFYLFVHNPTDKPRTLLVELLDGITPLAGGPVKVSVPAKETRPVAFPEAAQPAVPPVVTTASPATTTTPAPLPELTGPLQVRLLEAENPGTVWDQRQIRVGLALPQE